MAFAALIDEAEAEALPAQERELLPLTELLDEMSEEHDAADFLRYAGLAIGNEALVSRAEHGLAARTAASLAQFAQALIEGGEAAEVRSGVTAAVSEGQSRRVLEEADRVLADRRDELVDAVATLAGPPPMDEDALSQDAWEKLAQLDELLAERLGEDGTAEHILGEPIADVIARIIAEREREALVQAEAEAEAEEEFEALAEEQERIVGRLVQADAEADEPDFEDDGRIRSAVPIVPGKQAPEPYPSPAMSRAKDRQYGG